MTQISSYYAKVSLSTDMAALKKVDRYLKLLEAKMAKFHQKAMKTGGVFNINFKFNTNRLQFDVQKAFNDVSRRVAFPINRFQIDRNGLAAQINASIRQAVMGANRNLVLNPKVNQPRVTPSRVAVPQPGIRGTHVVGAGAAAGVFSRSGMFGRFGAPAILGGASLYGGAMLNRANQEIISAQLTTQAVVEAQGLAGQGPAAFEWLRSQGNRIGFSYLDQAQDYNNFLSNSLGAGRTLDQAQNTYLGFAEYARAMGTSPARQKLVMNALSQMEAKGTVSMEELRRQMAESMPGTMSVFAEALQRQTGGNLQGQAAMQALMEAVPEGKVKSDILPIVAEILRERAKPKLDVAMKTSQAEQARAVNLLTDFTNIASKAGLEEGFSRIFRTFTDGLSESEGLVKSLAEGFNTATKYAREFLLIPQSIVRMFEGKDSVFAEKFFPTEEDRAIAFEWLQSFKSATKELADFTNNVYEGWKGIVSLVEGSEVLKSLIAANQTIANTFGIVNSLVQGDTAAAGNKAAALGQSTGKVLENVPVIGQAVRAYNLTPDRFKPTTWAERFVSDAKSNMYEARDRRTREFSNMTQQTSTPSMVLRDINIEVNGANITGDNILENMEDLANKIVVKVKQQLIGDAIPLYPQTQ